MNHKGINNFFDLDVWKKSHKLTILTYKLISLLPKEETFGLISQLKRASISVELNIAEGFDRYHYRDKTRFYY